MAYKVVLYSGKSVQIAWDTLKQQISLWDLERINKNRINLSRGPFWQIRINISCA